LERVGAVGELRRLARRVAGLIEEADYLVAFTGAGVSAESGVPTFRGSGGLWEKHDPMELATPYAFARDPVRVWEWYRWRQELIYRARPNAMHLLLAELERRGRLKAVITQNVDGLHQRAGSRRVLELHGSIWRVICTSCGYSERLERPVRVIPPRCPRCEGLMRPGVVWFGEPLPATVFAEAEAEAARSDVMLVIGTSGAVMPAAEIPLLAKRMGATLVNINLEENAYTGIADVEVRSKAAEFARLLAEELGIKLKEGEEGEG